MTRRRVARLVAVVGIAVVGVYLFRSFPRDVEIRYALGDDHASVTEAHIAYLLEDGDDTGPLKGIRLEYPEGAPPTFRQVVELPPGRYRIRARLRGPGLSRRVTRTLEVPAEGLVHIELFDRGSARRPLLPGHAGVG